MRLNYGLKLWSVNTNLIEMAQELWDLNKIQFIELLIIPSEPNVDFFSSFSLPYIIHIPHENFGMDIGFNSDGNQMIDIINTYSDYADKLDVKHMVLHAGTGSESAARVVLENIDDRRILLENMPLVGLEGEECLGYNVESMSRINVKNLGLCLDIGHAIKAAVSLETDYRDILSEFMDWKPEVIHISDGKLGDEKDEHLNIGDGDYDFEFIKEMLAKNRTYHITLETPRIDHTSLSEDIENLEKLKGLLS